jgi:hypothetical protein
MLADRPFRRGVTSHHEQTSVAAVFLNPLWPFTAAKVLALKATVLLLLTLLIKAKIRITAFSALGLFLLLLQTLVFLAISGGALYVAQQRRPQGA